MDNKRKLSKSHSRRSKRRRRSEDMRLAPLELFADEGKLYYTGILKTSWGFKNYGNYYPEGEKVNYYEFIMLKSQWKRLLSIMDEIEADAEIITESSNHDYQKNGNFLEDLASTYFDFEQNSMLYKK